jgi:hypothetical protein
MKELGLEADLVNLDLKEKQHKTPEFIKVGPWSCHYLATSSNGRFLQL